MMNKKLKKLCEREYIDFNHWTGTEVTLDGEFSLEELKLIIEYMTCIEVI